MKILDEKFADIQILRYQLKGFDELSLKQRKLIFFLSEATLWGRDITFDQNCKYNLIVRKSLEAMTASYKGDRDNDDYQAMETMLKRVWFASGIHHHYGCEKFKAGFTDRFFLQVFDSTPDELLPLSDGMTRLQLRDILYKVFFDDSFLPKSVNKADGEDLILTSACNFYEGVTQQEVETFYDALKDPEDNCPPSWGLNSRLVKDADSHLHEEVWKVGGRYGDIIEKIIYWLRKAETVAENNSQRRVIQLLIEYYETGDLRTFDEYSIEWLHEHDAMVDFINGFIEVYGDPLGIKATWEGLVEYRDVEATRRTRTISDNAQWFEDHSPVDPRFKKKTVRGVTANVICAAMLGGEEYPASAIGINLPNADWIRARHGSKSVTIGNLTEAYNLAAKGNGFMDEFVGDAQTRELIDKYDNICDDLHTDLHECLGHGSGQLLPETSPDALKAYSNTIEEARADLFGLYYMADPKLVELGLLPDGEAYKAQYYTYMMNGLMTQLIRITPGNNIEEAHMRNRSLIAHWCLDHAGGAMMMEKCDGKTFLRITDYDKLRQSVAELLAEVQRIKSEGDYEAARQLVERYAVKVDAVLHKEILERYEKLNIAPYKGFVNPVLRPVYDADGEITDITVDYSEGYTQQMQRYSREYSI